MVIRSLGPKEGSANLDLHFHGVEFVRAPTIFNGLAVVTATDGEIAEAQTLVAHCDESMVWVLESERQRFLVVAASLDIAETDFPMMSTALIHPSI